MTMKTYIYGLIDPRTGQIFYVGKTVSGARRPRGHGQNCNLRDQTRRTNTIKAIRKAGQDYSWMILEEGPAEKLMDLEMKWIEMFRATGVDLANHTLGGEGALGRRISEETRKKLVESHRGLKYPNRAPRSNRGKKITGQALQNIREGIAKSWSKGRRSHLLGKEGRHPTSEERLRASISRGVGPILCSNGQVYPSLNEAAKSLNLHRSGIRRILQGKTKQTGGYTFSYLERS